MAYDIYLDDAYWGWINSAKINPVPDESIQDVDQSLKDSILKELDYLSSLDVTEYSLHHKYLELQDWFPSQDLDVIHEVKDLIWKPRGRGDYRYIEPELVFVKNSVLLDAVDFFGNKTERTLQLKGPYLQHWQIMRTLVSSARNDSTVGRQLRFIVRDKVSKQYLGVICISSEMMNLKPRNQSIGFKSSELVEKGTLHNMANGQSIIPTQPFGSAFNGGKLMALMCLSDVVQKTWEEFYGHKLITVSTTSLWGSNKNSSIYDGLSPYWKNLGKTEGKAPLKPSDELYNKVKEWLLHRHPEQYFQHYIRKRPSGQPWMRENKSRALTWTYRYLGIKSKEFTSQHTRGCYFSRLYKNSDEFLRGEIEENQLIPAFDNSLEALTEFWRFGRAGDTTTSPEELTRKFGKDLNRGAKGRLDKQVNQNDEYWIDESIEWYGDLQGLDWETVRNKYLNRVGR
jgi:Domain of unknown function (DUF4338)